MFERWGFLLSEIWVLLALAALLGLFVGWLIWGRRPEVTADTSESDRLRGELSACTARGKDMSGRIAGLERDLTAAQVKARDAEQRPAAVKMAAPVAPAPVAPAPVAPAPVMAAPVAPAPVMAAPVAPAPVAAPAPAPASAPVTAASGKAAKPKGLTTARGGKADDLKLVKGIGPKLEILCNKLGFYHFDQIANWTAAEIAWVDENLEGFKGRVTRDEWVAQARDLAAGKPPRKGGEN